MTTRYLPLKSERLLFTNLPSETAFTSEKLGAYVLGMGKADVTSITEVRARAAMEANTVLIFIVYLFKWPEAELI